MAQFSPKICSYPVPKNPDVVLLKDITLSFSETNPGGYAPSPQPDPPVTTNPARAGLFAVMLAARKLKNKRTSVAMLGAQDYAAGTQWRVDARLDGHYEFILVLAPAWDEVTPFLSGMVRFHRDPAALPGQGGGLYLALQGVPAGVPLTDTAYWKRINLLEEFPLSSPATGAYFRYRDHLHTEHNAKCVNEAGFQYGTSIKCDPCSGEINEMAIEFAKMLIFFSAGSWSFHRGEREAGSDFTEHLRVHYCKTCATPMTDPKTPCGC